MIIKRKKGMTMTYIRFIRHGETDWNKQARMQGWTDIPLNDTGKMQASEAAKRLNDKAWNVFIASPLIRAKYTAEILNESLQLPIMTMEAFRERRYGKVEGMLRAERVKQYPSGEYPEAETRDDLTKRVIEGIQLLHQNYEGQNILVATHGGTINAVLTYFSNGELGFDRTTIHNLSFTDIELSGTDCQIHCYNRIENR